MENLRGAAFMTFSMLAFAIEDVLIKTLGARIPGGQIISIIGAGGALPFTLCGLTIHCAPLHTLNTDKLAGPPARDPRGVPGPPKTLPASILSR